MNGLPQIMHSTNIESWRPTSHVFCLSPPKHVYSSSMALPRHVLWRCATNTATLSCLRLGWLLVAGSGHEVWVVVRGCFRFWALVVSGTFWSQVWGGSSWLFLVLGFGWLFVAAPGSEAGVTICGYGARVIVCVCSGSGIRVAVRCCFWF